MTTDAAPCSGQRTADGACFICGHTTEEHDGNLVCRTCHEPCAYCGEQRDQHTVPEWRSCLIDLATAEAEADALAWWRSQQT